MAAAPFTETTIFKGQRTGESIQLRLTCSDVTTQFATAPDSNTFIQLPADQNWALIDIIVVTGGTDTTQQQVFANSRNTGLVIDNKSNLNTANNRQFQQAPVLFKAGSLLRLQQVT